MLAVAALLGGFIGKVLWFDRVDFYNKHFFDTGAIVFAYNLAMRLIVRHGCLYLSGMTSGDTSSGVAISRFTQLRRATRINMSLSVRSRM